MIYEHKLDLFKECIELLEAVGNGKNPPKVNGEYPVCICELLREYRKQLSFAVGVLAVEWEYYSGSCAYPVPNPAYLGNPDKARNIFLKSDDSSNELILANYWDNEYGKYRRKLCLFMAKRFKENLSALLNK